MVIGRQALHASLLGFEHPTENEEQTYVAPLPDDMRTLIEFLRRDQFVRAPEVAGAELDLDRMMGSG